MSDMLSGIFNETVFYLVLIKCCVEFKFRLLFYIFFITYCVHLGILFDKFIAVIMNFTMVISVTK